MGLGTKVQKVDGLRDLHASRYKASPDFCGGLIIQELMRNGYVYLLGKSFVIIGIPPGIGRGIGKGEEGGAEQYRTVSPPQK